MEREGGGNYFGHEVSFLTSIFVFTAFQNNSNSLKIPPPTPKKKKKTNRPFLVMSQTRMGYSWRERDQHPPHLLGVCVVNPHDCLPKIANDYNFCKSIVARGGGGGGLWGGGRPPSRRGGGGGAIGRRKKKKKKKGGGGGRAVKCEKKNRKHDAIQATY